MTSERRMTRTTDVIESIVSRTILALLDKHPQLANKDVCLSEISLSAVCLSSADWESFWLYVLCVLAVNLSIRLRVGVGCVLAGLLLSGRLLCCVLVAVDDSVSFVVFSKVTSSS